MGADPGAAAASVVDALTHHAVPHAIGGALCLAYWGVPRATKDVDVNVFVDDAHLSPVFDALLEAGCTLDREASVARARERGDIVAWLSDVRVDVFVSFHSFHDEVARRVARASLPGGPETSFLSAEDLCVFKVLFWRAKDLVDLDRLFVARGRDLDMAYVQRWLADLLGPEDDRPHEVARRFERAVSG